MTPLKGGVFKVEATIENEGFFPTNVTEYAKRIGISKPVVAFLELHEGAELVLGKPWITIGDLEGRSDRLQEVPYYRANPPELSRKTVEWLVRTPEKFKAIVKVVSEKAGTDGKEVDFE